MTETANKPKVLFWIISGVALLWNLLGVMAFAMHAMMNPEMLAAMPETQQAQYAALPSWYTIVFGIAVIAATLGCIGLLLRKKWATILFMLSLVAVIIQQIVFWVMTDIGKSASGFNLVMTIMIPVIAIFLVWFARKKTAKGWLT